MADDREPPHPPGPASAGQFRFVDAHVHFWDHQIDGLRWPYLDPGFEHPRLRGMHRLDAPRFTDVELVDLAGPYAPRRVVHVQSATEVQPGVESEWMQRLADESRLDVVAAIVARIRLSEPDVPQVIDANRCRLLRGFRDMASPATIESDEFAAGFDHLAAAASTLEVLVPYPKFAAVEELARRHPATTIVLGHAGQPEQRDRDYFERWSAALKRFRSLDNVVVKISALASGADPDWSVESLRPWVETCIDVFSPRRAMFASNWPIDRLYGTYHQLVEAYLEIASGVGADDRAWLLWRTATRTYQIDERGSDEVDRCQPR